MIILSDKMEIPKQLQDKLMQFQNMQNQLQMFVYQKQQLLMQNNEIENAITELGKAGDGKIYSAAGPLFIETGKQASQKNLKEKKDTNDARIKLLEKQETKTNEKLTELKGELEVALKGQGGLEDAG